LRQLLLGLFQSIQISSRGSIYELKLRFIHGTNVEIGEEWWRRYYEKGIMDIVQCQERKKVKKERT
jgi:hypothetical protein